MWFHTECVILHTLCNFAHSVWFSTQCINLHTVCYLHIVCKFYTQCVILHIVCNLRCFVASKFLSRIYALLRVKFPRLKMCWCKKNDKYEVCSDKHFKSQSDFLSFSLILMMMMLLNHFYKGGCCCFNDIQNSQLTQILKETQNPWLDAKMMIMMMISMPLI